MGLVREETRFGVLGLDHGRGTVTVTVTVTVTAAERLVINMGR
jgi:hypothetical protein